MAIDLGTEIRLTELGKKIVIELLLSHPQPYIITFVLYMKEKNEPILVRDLWERYIVANIGDSAGNLAYLKHVISEGIKCGLIELNN